MNLPFIFTEDNNLSSLVVLVEEELVVLDLTSPDWLPFKLPYLSCLHSSPITCSQHISNVSDQVLGQIMESDSPSNAAKYSQNDWPINGGISKFVPETSSASNQRDLFVTGHEDGSVNFWDASTLSLRHLITLSTSKLFESPDGDLDSLAMVDDDEEEEGWPPFRKVGNFDPYSDDPKLAIRKVCFCSKTGTLAVGGTAGQVLVYKLPGKLVIVETNNSATDAPVPQPLTTVKLNIIDEKDSFVWKGHGALKLKASNKLPKTSSSNGYTPCAMLQIYPPAALTALQASPIWSLVAVGTAHGYGLFDYTSKKIIVCRTTLKAWNLAQAVGGDAIISRRKSFKKSLRESFRRLRKGRSQKNVSKTDQAKDGGPKLGRFQEEMEAKPVERQIEARTDLDLMSSMVRSFYFCSTTIINSKSTAK